jgi:hypothetical protein
MTRQHYEIGASKVKTPDIIGGSFLMKDVQNFTDMSFDQLGNEVN